MDPARRYREVQVTTASQDGLLLLLLDGGVRFTEGALMEMEKGAEEDVARRNDHLIRAQKILLELIGALSPAIGLEPYQNLQELYRFTFSRLFEGNVNGDRTLVAEGLQLYKRLRAMWRETVEKARAENAARPSRPSSGSTLSLQG